MTGAAKSLEERRKNVVVLRVESTQEDEKTSILLVLSCSFVWWGFGGITLPFEGWGTCVAPLVTPDQRYVLRATLGQCCSQHIRARRATRGTSSCSSLPALSIDMRYHPEKPSLFLCLEHRNLQPTVSSGAETRRREVAKSRQEKRHQINTKVRTNHIIELPLMSSFRRSGICTERSSPSCFCSLLFFRSRIVRVVSSRLLDPTSPALFSAPHSTKVSD